MNIKFKDFIDAFTVDTKVSITLFNNGKKEPLYDGKALGCVNNLSENFPQNDYKNATVAFAEITNNTLSVVIVE